jgi:photosystem II stability/assembly factor-like uncharacterized protein
MSDDDARVRARLHEYADAVEPVSDIPAAGRARYRRRVRRRSGAAVLAGVLVVVGASGVGVELSRGPSHSVQFATHGASSSSSAGPTATTEPSILVRSAIADTTWISDDAGWALTRSSILQTIDGGLTWRSVADAPASVTHIRFADARHGYLFGDSFFTTDDGGATWTHSSSPPVVALEVAHGRAYRLVSVGDGCPGPCDYELQSSVVGTSLWARVTTPDIGPGTEAQLLYDGPRLYIATYQSAMGSTERHLVRSVDSGATWQSSPNPCSLGVQDLLVQLAAAPGGFVAALCRHAAGGTYVRASSDAGATFGPGRSLPSPFSAPGGGGAAIAAGTSTSIVVVGIDGANAHVVVSHDVGASWAETLTVPGFTINDGVSFLGFEDAQTGRVAIGDSRIWTTRDGGDTWTAHRA